MPRITWPCTQSATRPLSISCDSHDNVDLLRPSGTRIVCDPAGPGFTNPAFRDDWVVMV